MRARQFLMPLVGAALLAGCSDSPEPPRDRESVGESIAVQTTPETTTNPVTEAPTTPVPTTPEPTDGSVSYAALQIGDCLNSDDIMGVIDSVTLLECTEPHDAEVIASYEIAPPYPGQDAVIAQIETDCVAFATTWGAEDPSRTGLSLGYVMPTDGDYARGITNFLCVAIAPESVTAPF